MLLEPSARAWVRTNAKRVVEKLLPWLLVPFGDANVTDVADAEKRSAVASRAAATLSRCAREKETTRALLSARGAGGALAVCDLVAQTAQRVLATETSDPSFAAAAAALDGGTRVFNGARGGVFAALDGDVDGDVDGDATDAEATALARGARRGVVAGGVRVFAEWTVPDGVVGNAALALGDLARLDRVSASLESLEPGAVPSLLAACRARSGAAQKNAAIACARLARRAPHMAALKEHHGLELIYAYVKP